MFISKTILLSKNRSNMAEINDIRLIAINSPKVKLLERYILKYKIINLVSNSKLSNWFQRKLVLLACNH